MSTCKCIFNSKNTGITKWLVEKIGPVLMGTKPAELLSFLNNDEDLNKKLSIINNSLGRCVRVKHKVIKLKNNNVKVLFYNENKLNNVLTDKRNIKFLKQQGYPKEYNFQDYMRKLISKIALGIIPHEIGIFLGYPLKDVLGFIGHPSLKLTKICGWRVYGYSEPSDQIFNAIQNSKQTIKSLLKNKAPEEVLLMSV